LFSFSGTSRTFWLIEGFYGKFTPDREMFVIINDKGKDSGFYGMFSRR
jgi:hypothetical protein